MGKQAIPCFPIHMHSRNLSARFCEKLLSDTPKTPRVHTYLKPSYLPKLRQPFLYLLHHLAVLRLLLLLLRYLNCRGLAYKLLIL